MDGLEDFEGDNLQLILALQFFCSSCRKIPDNDYLAPLIQFGHIPVSRKVTFIETLGPFIENVVTGRLAKMNSKAQLFDGMRCQKALF